MIIIVFTRAPKLFNNNNNNITPDSAVNPLQACNIIRYIYVQQDASKLYAIGITATTRITLVFNIISGRKRRQKNGFRLKILNDLLLLLHIIHSPSVIHTDTVVIIHYNIMCVRVRVRVICVLLLFPQV